MSSALPFAARAAVARLLRPPHAASRALSPSHLNLARRNMAAPAYDAKQTPAPEGMSRVLFVQVGMGIDQHGQDATKAAVRAVKHAIERNSIPCAKEVCGSYDAVKIHVKLGVPFPDQRIDASAIEKVFPYGHMLPLQVVHGGLAACSGIMVPQMGDAEDAMCITVAAVTVGH